jgi:hypothetical protein
VTLEPPHDPDHVSSFLNIRVADIHPVYETWGDRGAEFLTPPADRSPELRCYMRDPDGHLIEVGQRTPDHSEGNGASMGEVTLVTGTGSLDKQDVYYYYESTLSL